MPITSPLIIQTKLFQKSGMKIYYPVITDYWDEDIQDNINRSMYECVSHLVEQQYKKQDVTMFEEMIGTFELKTNERHVLSISFTNYAFASMHAHGLTLMKSLTFDIKTGKHYSLSELFKDGSNYVDIISQNVQEQIDERDIPTLEPFTTLSRNQDYYIADKALVIYFPVYELTPGYYGFPMFPISVYELSTILLEDAPLDRMVGN